jgi:hypothetical protein
MLAGLQILKPITWITSAPKINAMLVEKGMINSPKAVKIEPQNSKLASP